MINIIMAVFQIILGLGIIGFWIYFFLVENKDPEKTEVYLKHEKSFPLPDLGWIVPCLFIAAIGLLTEQNFGIYFTIAAGSGMMFLGLIDLAFDLQHGLFKTKDMEAYFNITIVSITMIFAVIFLIYGWLNI